MMTYNNILIDIHDQVLTITVNRPDKLNALNAHTIQEIGDAVAQGVRNKDIAGMIITGAGPKAFVAGADILEFSNFSREQGMALSAAETMVLRSREFTSMGCLAVSPV